MMIVEGCLQLADPQEEELRISCGDLDETSFSGPGQLMSAGLG